MNNLDYSEIINFVPSLQAPKIVESRLFHMINEG